MNSFDQLNHALQRVGALTVGDIELLAGFDTNNEAVRNALWLPEHYSHPDVPRVKGYKSDRKKGVMARCHTLIANRLRRGEICLWSAQKGRIEIEIEEVRVYDSKGLAGCVQQRKARENGVLVGVYRNDQAGMDDNGGKEPWSTVCEAHGHIVSHTSLKLAKSHAAEPRGWCETCMANENAAGSAL
jgi:hypothetical protein